MRGFGWMRKIFSKKEVHTKKAMHDSKVREVKAKKSIDDYIIREKKGVLLAGVEVMLKGNAFAQKNEQLMRKRRQCLAEVGVEGKQAEKVIHLYRIRKAASEVRDCIGFITTETAAALLEFMHENRANVKRYLKWASEDGVRQGFPKGDSAVDEKMYANTVSSLEHALRTNDPEVKKTIENPLNSALVGMAQRADFALNPEGPMELRFTRGNPLLMSMLPFSVSNWMIEQELGDKFERFNLRVRQERKKI
ncbi:MAG: hypothetical protein AABW59_02680 [archaeon]